MRTVYLLILAACAALVISVALNVRSAPDGARSVAPDRLEGSGAPFATIHDGPEVRAIAVFIRFRDDDYGSESWIPVNSPLRGWPYWLHDDEGNVVYERGAPVVADFERLPPIAHAFLAPNKAAIPDSDSTISAYFYQQSKAGDGPAQFHLWGDVLPTNGARWDEGEPIVYVTKHPNAWYYNEPSEGTRRGYGYLTKEVLDHLVYEQGVDLGHYNLNPEADDVVDQIFMFVRDEERGHHEGVSNLAFVASKHLTGAPEGTGAKGLWYPSPSGQRDPDLPDSVRVDWRASGLYLFNDAAGNVHQPTYYSRMGAHEYGHDLWRDKITSVHLTSVTANDVPANEPDDKFYYGPVLMGTSGQFKHRHTQGTSTISAYERSLLGWVALDTLTTSRLGVQLGDLYTRGEAAVIPIGSGDTERAVFLSNLQRIGYFDRTKVALWNDAVTTSTSGLAATGLLAHFRGRRDGKDCNAGRQPCLDLLAADNEVHLKWQDPEYWQGDMYGPAPAKPQLTPWTRPSINGCTGSADTYCHDLETTWAAIDDIRYLGDADSTLVFDFHQDFRTAPTVFIRADSWMGPETDGYVFQREVRVTNGATLTVEAGTDVDFAGGLIVDDGANVVYEKAAVNE